MNSEKEEENVYTNVFRKRLKTKPKRKRGDSVRATNKRKTFFQGDNTK